MSDSVSKEGTTWPKTKFYFEVDLGARLKGVMFQEVFGLNEESDLIEYRAGVKQMFSTIKMPGIVKSGNITLKHGVFVNEDAFLDLYDEIAMNTIKRRTVLIKLLDEKGDVAMQWQLKNAYPTKISSTNLEPDGGEVAVDTVEIAHEELIITNG